MFEPRTFPTATPMAPCPNAAKMDTRSSGNEVENATRTKPMVVLPKPVMLATLTELLIVTREVAAKYHGVREIPLLPFEEQRKKLYECVIGLMKMDAKDMLCVGDSVWELMPAKRLGIKTIGVLTGFSNKEDMEKASIPTIQALSQLFKILS
jgi:ribonucleotide monophosphatase NagD (HAD superfamily)